MAVDWSKLEITQQELAELIDLNLLSTWAINNSRVLLLDLKEYRQDLIFANTSNAFLVYLFIFPINLIVFRHLGWLSNNTSGLVLVLVSAAAIAFLILLIFNYYLWRKAKQLKIFAVLLEKVRHYNSLVSNLKLAIELNLLKSDRANNKHHPIESELEQALILTRNSLINSIELEKIINRDSQLANNRYHLLTNLESGLMNLGSLTLADADNYQQLLSEAIEIGLSVHQEIRKTHTK